MLVKLATLELEVVKKGIKGVKTVVILFLMN